MAKYLKEKVPVDRLALYGLIGQDLDRYIQQQDGGTKSIKKKSKKKPKKSRRKKSRKTRKSPKVKKIKLKK